MHRSGHDVSGFQGVHHTFLGQCIGDPINLPEVGRGDVDITLHGLHGFQDVVIRDIDGGTLSKVGGIHCIGSFKSDVLNNLFAKLQSFADFKSVCLLMNMYH